MLLNGYDRLSCREITKSLTVVVVDDDALMLSAIRRTIHGLPVELRLATSARAALRLVEEQPPALLISDLKMPEMDGAALISEVRRRFPSVRCVLHTAEDEDQTRGLGVQVLSKPCPPAELEALILSMAEEPRACR
jgi:CheY-like chemotaxis protein